jgi:phosphoribosylcarboxyaminoimidazole (NCAIR) mutase
MAIGAAGAKNAAILAAQILATTDPDMEARLEEFKENLASEVAQKAEAMRQNR